MRFVNLAVSVSTARAVPKFQLVGKQLRKLPSNRTSWKTWRKRHPDTLVLSTETGYYRDYSRDPYAGYYRVGTIWFPVGEVRKDLSPKERVIGIEVKHRTRAYPLAQLQEKPGITADSLGGESIHIEVSAEGEVKAVKDGRGGEIPHIYAYWFAWQAFHPDTTVYRGGECYALGSIRYATYSVIPEVAKRLSGI